MIIFARINKSFRLGHTDQSVKSCIKELRFISIWIISISRVSISDSAARTVSYRGTGANVSSKSIPYFWRHPTAVSFPLEGSRNCNCQTWERESVTLHEWDHRFLLFFTTFGRKRYPMHFAENPCFTLDDGIVAFKSETFYSIRFLRQDDITAIKMYEPLVSFQCLTLKHPHNLLISHTRWR